MAILDRYSLTYFSALSHLKIRDRVLSLLGAFLAQKYCVFFLGRLLFFLLSLLFLILSGLVGDYAVCNNNIN